MACLYHHLIEEDSELGGLAFGLLRFRSAEFVEGI